MDSYRNEIFGPVLEVVRVPTYTDAVKLVNDNPYGNGTAIFTRDGGAARQFQFEVEAGGVGINLPIPVPWSELSLCGRNKPPFGSPPHYRPPRRSVFPRATSLASPRSRPGTSQIR